MRTYRLNRERPQLEECLAASRKRLDTSVTPLIRLMCRAEVASYEHALTITSPHERIAADIQAVIEHSTILPHVALLIWGLAVFHHDQKSTQIMLDLPLSKLATETQTHGRDAKHRARILRIMANLYAATQAAGQGDPTQMTERIEALRHDLASRRLTGPTYNRIATLADILYSCIKGHRFTDAWERRQAFLNGQTNSKKELYHPAGLLDLQSLALMDAAQRCGAQTYCALPLLPALPNQQLKQLSA